MSCLGIIAWPYIVFGVVVGSFIITALLSRLSKKYLFNFKKTVLVSLVFSLIVMAVIHVVAPPKYKFDLRIAEALKTSHLEYCDKAEIGLGMFQARWADPEYRYENWCYHEFALEVGEEAYCDMITSAKRYNCLSDLTLIKKIAVAKCNNDYDLACVTRACNQYQPGFKSVKSIYGCVSIMTQKAPETCAIFGDSIPYMEQCKK